MGSETYHHLKAAIKAKFCVEAIEKAGYTGKIKIGMDVAASEFCKEGNKYDWTLRMPIRSLKIGSALTNFVKCTMASSKMPLWLALKMVLIRMIGKDGQN